MLPWLLLADQTFTVKVVRSELRWEVLKVAVAIVLLGTGLSATALFYFRRKTRDLALVYFGLFSVLYGVRLLALQGVVEALFDASPPFWALVAWFLTCTINVPVGLFLYQVANEHFRKVFRWLVAIQALFAVFGIFAPFAGANIDRLQKANNVLVLGTVVGAGLFALFTRRRAFPGKSISGDIRVVVAGFFIWLLFVLHANLYSLRLVPGPDVEFLGFLICVGCLGYVAAHRTFVNEERLLAINKELEIAQQIQSSLLPREVPRLAGLDIAARHLSMSAVAGDFYDFLVIDEKHVGVLIADVTGHGVPAALIASMLKVAFAAQSDHADAPARVLAGLNRALCGKFDDHFVTAAYVFIDLEAEVMRYAGAGHPPLMVISRANGKAQQIEENGLMLGLFPEAEYTAVEIPLTTGDRYLLCTDGVLEASNAAKQEFGRAGSLQFLESNSTLSAKSFSDKLVETLARWSGNLAGGAQEDDITLVVLDFQPAPL
ncbi:MAG: SpoIIE family protein phosphatase [Candidatus Acidiferrum sp.]|jgi:phosphoserine phosphatase RsbU/P